MNEQATRCAYRVAFFFRFGFGQAHPGEFGAGVHHAGNGDGVLLGEVNLPYDQQLDFFGGADGDELTMQFDFMSMQAAYLAFARGELSGRLDLAVASYHMGVGNLQGVLSRFDEGDDLDIPDFLK